MLGSIGVVLGSGLLAWPFARLLHADYRTFVPPMMFNNCGNMGLPLAALAYGAAGILGDGRAVHDLQPAALHARRVDHRPPRALRQPAAQSDGLVDVRWASRSPSSHPPMPEWGSVAIKLVGDALIPMMLLSLGVRLYEVRWDDWRLGVVGGLVCPLTGIAIAALLAPAARARPDAAGPADPLRLRCRRPCSISWSPSSSGRSRRRSRRSC